MKHQLRMEMLKLSLEIVQSYRISLRYASPFKKSWKDYGDCALKWLDVSLVVRRSERSNLSLGRSRSRQPRNELSILLKSTVGGLNLMNDEECQNADQIRSDHRQSCFSSWCVNWKQQEWRLEDRGDWISRESLGNGHRFSCWKGRMWLAL